MELDFLWARRGESLVATAAPATTSEGAAVPGPSEEISFLVEPLDEAVRGSQPGAGAAPAARREEAAGFLPWAPDACLPEPWLQQAPLCQISPALGCVGTQRCEI